jgi:hypothetical protein
MCVLVVTRPQLRDLIAQVRDHDRVQPVVVLTSLPGSLDPSLSPAAIRAIIGADAHLYFVRTGHLTKALEEKLGPRLCVKNGDARIFWAGASPATAKEHPLVPAPVAEDHHIVLDLFAGRLRATRPVTRRSVEELERQRDVALARVEDLQAALATRTAERDHARELVEAERVSFAEAQAAVRTAAARQARRQIAGR